MFFSENIVYPRYSLAKIWFNQNIVFMVKVVLSQTIIWSKCYLTNLFPNLKKQTFHRPILAGNVIAKVYAAVYFTLYLLLFSN